MSYSADKPMTTEKTQPKERQAEDEPSEDANKWTMEKDVQENKQMYLALADDD